MESVAEEQEKLMTLSSTWFVHGPIREKRNHEKNFLFQILWGFN